MDALSPFLYCGEYDQNLRVIDLHANSSALSLFGMMATAGTRLSEYVKLFFSDVLLFP
jgi:hypothetical protein